MKASNKVTTPKNFRLKAENLLKKNPVDISNKLSEADILKLIHEFQVHQIELELQNEELVKAIGEANAITEKYSELFDFAPIAYYSLSGNAEIVELNLMGAKLLGKERSRLLNYHFGLFVSSKSRPIFNRYIEKLFSGHKTETCEITLLGENKKELHVVLNGIRKKNDEICLVSVLDITSRKQMEKELILAKEQAEENNKLKTAFLQNVSHEIRTPLNAIKGFASLLVQNDNNTENLEKFTKIIDQRSDDLLDIINDILDISKIESGQTLTYEEEFNLFALFEELTLQFEDYKKHLHGNDINFSIKINFDPQDTIIITDRGKLKQILVNLISNAFKFTEEGSIEVDCKIEKQMLLFKVKDTGIGIPSDKIDEIFDRFVQLKQMKRPQIGGTGLGLPITKGLIDILNGKLSLDSIQGKGSVFSFYIPCKVFKDTSQKSMNSAQTENYYFPNKTILVVEDEECNIIFFKELLKNTGLKLFFAKSGEEAVEIARTEELDLVLMDIKLPGIDGYETNRQISQNKPNLTIIAQTAYAASSDNQRAIKEGFKDYISKPIKNDKMLSMISKYLSND